MYLLISSHLPVLVFSGHEMVIYNYFAVIVWSLNGYFSSYLVGTLQ